jgi:hypothetical protein
MENYLISIVNELSVCIQNLHQCGLASSDPELSHSIDRNTDRLVALKKELVGMVAIVIKHRKDLVDS